MRRAGSDSRAGRETCRTTGLGDPGSSRDAAHPESLTILQGFVHQQKTQQQPNLHLLGEGSGRGAGERGWEARGQRRTRAGAPGEAAGEGRAPGTPQLEDSVSGGRTQILGESLGIFFLIHYLCNVTSPAPWWSREALRFFPEAESEMSITTVAQRFPLPARLTKFTSFEKARRNPAGSHLTRIAQMSPELSHQLVRP